MTIEVVWEFDDQSRLPVAEAFSDCDSAVRRAIALADGFPKGFMNTEERPRFIHLLVDGRAHLTIRLFADGLMSAEKP